MMDDPHAPEHRDEASFMLAAEAAIKDLQNQAEEAKTAAGVAENAASRAEESAKRWKILTVVMSVIIVLTLALSGLGVNLWLGQRAATGQLRQQAIASCETGNDRAAGTVTALDQLVGILEGTHPSADVKKIASAYEAFVLAHNQARNCQQAYSPAAGSSPSPSSLGAVYAIGMSVAVR